MSIFLGHHSRIIVQGMTGSEGRKHTQRMIMAGSRVVGGVTPGKGGESVRFEENPVPVFDSVADAKLVTGADVSVIFVPAPFAKNAVLEAVAAEISLVVCITEGIPALDMVKAWEFLQGKGTRLVGPNCPGVISPGKCKIGIMPG
ncbi:MAG TPA: CoA-binding protein, partial [Propionibacteriaceae bacterium]|nr:CoA-binding protein [Propionibacteriaceae bacterium]